MRKLLSVILLIAMTTVLAGCKTTMRDRIEIDKILIVSAFGIDMPREDADNVMLTVTSKRLKPGGGGGGGGGDGSQKRVASTLSSEGRTVLEAVRKLHSSADRRVFQGHMEHILIGEEAAKNGILKYIDFLERDHEIRLNALVFIVMGDTAAHVLEKGNTSEYFLSDRLSNLLENRGGMSVSGRVELYNLMGLLDHKKLSAYIPCIRLAKVKDMSSGEDKERYDIVLDGYAIFKDDKLIGYITGEEARGFNWVTGRVESAPIIVKGPSDEEITLEVVKSSVKVEPRISGDDLSVEVKIRVSSNVDEIRGREDVFIEETFNSMERQQEEFVKSEVLKAIAFAQQNNADFFDIHGALNRKYPTKSKKFLDEWENIFPKTKITVSVDSIIERTYNIKQPTGKVGD